MNMLEAFDLTGSLRDAGELAGVSHHTVGRYVAAREAGALSDRPAARSGLVDEFLPKLEEWIERSKGKLRADWAHEKLTALGYTGSERTTRRAVATVKRDYRLGRVRVHRPWVTEPGMWLQYDFGDGPVIDGVKTTLFVAWLAWSRFRVVLAIRDKTAPSVMGALDVTLRRIGGAPTYVLTDNEKTVTTEHVAGMPVRNPEMVEFARHYGVTIHTCVPADPASKGGSESSVKIAKADLVPQDTNLLDSYDSFADLEAACEAFCAQVNARVHRVTRRAPDDMLAQEQARLHPIPAVPHTVAFGVTRTVPATMPMVSFEGGQYSVPAHLLGQVVWVRVHGRGPTSRSSSSTWAPTGPWRWPGTPVPPRAARRSRPATSRPHRPGRWSVNHWPVTNPRPRSSRSVTVQDCGWPRPPPPAPPRSASRWPKPSRWPSCSRPRTWTGRRATPRSAPASLRPTSPRSWIITPAPPPMVHATGAGEDGSLTQG